MILIFDAWNFVNIYCIIFENVCSNVIQEHVWILNADEIAINLQKY